MKTYEGIKATANLLVCRANEDGGMGEIYRAGKRWASVNWSTGGGWDHVSVCPYNRRTPTWDEMCAVKDMFFRDDEVVVQYHPAKSEYVNIDEYKKYSKKDHSLLSELREKFYALRGEKISESEGEPLY